VAREFQAWHCGAIALDALAPLYRKYPALKPDTWPQDI
jgi:hypothetical protein